MYRLRSEMRVRIWRQSIDKFFEKIFKGRREISSLQGR